MSEEAADNNSLLLTSSGDAGGANLMALGLLGGGIALLALGKKKKDEKKEGKKGEATKAIEGGDPSSVTFDKDFDSFQIGANWRRQVLEPYLEDSVEERSLATRGWEHGDGGELMPPDKVSMYIEYTRNNVMSAFFKTHKVINPKGEKYISILPDTDAVREFKSTVENWITEFQETF